jgi:hypothetical protein
MLECGPPVCDAVRSLYNSLARHYVNHSGASHRASDSRNALTEQNVQHLGCQVSLIPAYCSQSIYRVVNAR